MMGENDCNQLQDMYYYHFHEVHRFLQMTLKHLPETHHPPERKSTSNVWIDGSVAFILLKQGQSQRSGKKRSNVITGESLGRKCSLE